MLRSTGGEDEGEVREEEREAEGRMIACNRGLGMAMKQKILGYPVSSP